MFFNPSLDQDFRHVEFCYSWLEVHLAILIITILNLKGLSPIELHDSKPSKQGYLLKVLERSFVFGLSYITPSLLVNQVTRIPKYAWPMLLTTMATWRFHSQRRSWWAKSLPLDASLREHWDEYPETEPWDSIISTLTTWSHTIPAHIDEWPSRNYHSLWLHLVPQPLTTHSGTWKWARPML